MTPLTVEERREFIDPPALDLAGTPTELRCDAILKMIDDVEIWLRKACPDMTEEEFYKVKTRFTFEVVKRSVEISKGCSGAVGRA